MICQVDHLVEDVRVCMDENAVSAALVASSDVDTLSLNEIIRSKLTEAVDGVHSMAPACLLECGHNFGDALYWGEMESGWVLLPDDFLRLVVFEMDDWAQAVYEAISAGSAAYARQRSRVKALRGTWERPVCAFGVRGEGRVLEFYSCKSEDASVRRAVYIPRASVDRDGGIDVSERCKDAVVYRAAGLTLTSLGEVDKAGVMFNLSKECLGL